MQTINLLPKTASPDRTGLILMAIAQLSMVGIIIGLVLAATGFQASQNQLAKQLTERQQEKERLKDTLARAQQLQLELAYIEDRKKAWEELSTKNPLMSQLLNDLTASLPVGVQLTSLSIKGGDLSLAGLATDRSAVTAFTDGLNRITTLTNATVGQTTAQENGISFSVTAKLSSSNPSPSPKATTKEGS